MNYGAKALSDFQFAKNLAIIFADFDSQSTTETSYFLERLSTKKSGSTKLVLHIPQFPRASVFVKVSLY